MEKPAKRYTPGERWHRTPGGKVLRCAATVRTCPYAVHFDTQEEAFNPRQTVAKTAVARPSSLVHFVGTIGGPQEVPEGVAARKNLRESANEARMKYVRDGIRPEAPLGHLAVHLPGGKKLTLRRETFDYQEAGVPQVGARYYVRYFPDSRSYFDATVPLNSRRDFQALDYRLQDFIITHEGTPEEAALTQERYSNLMQTISEIEIMARGSEAALKEVGVDLFDRKTPNTLNITSSYSHGVVQSYDITDALKVHALEDREVQAVTLDFTEPLGEGQGHWILRRTEEGEWYVGANTPRAVVAQRVEDPRAAEDLLRNVFTFYKVPEGEQEEQLTFVKSIMNEVEPAVQAYESAVAARLRSHESFPQREPRQEVKKSFTGKVLGLFGG